MAEYLLRHMVKALGCAESFVIDSAATSTEEIGNPVHPGTRSKLQQQGVYCGAHAADIWQRPKSKALPLAGFYSAPRRYCGPMVHWRF